MFTNNIGIYIQAIGLGIIVFIINIIIVVADDIVNKAALIVANRYVCGREGEWNMCRGCCCCLKSLVLFFVLSRKHKAVAVKVRD